MRRPRRSRIARALAIVAVIAAGLASRGIEAIAAGPLGKYPGDALWALMVFLGLGLLARTASTLRLGAVAFAIAALVETSQLWHPAWLDAIRATTLGHLVLGSWFAPGDFVAYAIGVALGVGSEVLLARGGATCPTRTVTPESEP
jgi:hypothetical protein